MKISFAFRTRLYYVSIINTFTICYAVVNLLFRKLQFTFLAHNEPSVKLFQAFGGLKWTRTIDLTLIRRVL